MAFKTDLVWIPDQYRVGIIPLPVEIGLRWLQKLGVDMSPRPHAHRRAWARLSTDQAHFIFWGGFAGSLFESSVLLALFLHIYRCTFDNIH